MRVLAVAVAAAILFLHLCAVVVLLDRPLHYDENEYLHAGWLMAAGKHLYIDFFEDHPPHLFVLLQAVMPGGDPHGVDVLDWTRRARLLSAFFGTTVVALAMLFVWRATRDPAAPPIAAAVLLSSPQLWSRGLSDIRAEAPTLALFWAGVVLLTWSDEASRRQAIRAGAGIGLIFFAVTWNPKWPLEAAVAGVYFLWLAWRLWKARCLTAAIVPAIVIAVLGILPIVVTTTLDDYLFFNVKLKAAAVDAFTHAQWVRDDFARNPVWATTSVQFRWWWIVAAIAVATALCLRMARAERRLMAIAIVLNVSALIELRFIYQYPYLWAQYLVMIATSSAILYPLIPAALKTNRKPIVLAVATLLAIGVTIVAGPPLARVAGLSWWLCIAAMALAWLPLFLAGRATISLATACAAGAFAILSLGQLIVIGLRPNDAWTFYWNRQAEMQAAADRDHTVFVSPPRHPVAAFDASYYWYSFKEAAPFAIRYAATHASPLPRIGFSDLPPCKLPPNVRLIEVAPWTFHLDDACRCVETAFRQFALKPTDSFGIFETHADPASSLTPRAREWGVRTAPVWRDLCAHRGTLANERGFDALAARK